MITDNGDPARPAGQDIHSAGIRCDWCGQRHVDGEEEWRICRCCTIYCVACAAYPCHSCAAVPGPRVNDDESGSVNGEGNEVMEHHVAAPPPMTPDDAHRRRMQWRTEKAEALSLRRAESRVLAKTQIQQGRRPRKPRLRGGTTTFITANPNTAENVKDEIENGTVFKQADYLLLQEMKIAGETKDAFIRWAREHEWDGVATDAYVKKVKYGGGVAIMAKGEGIRPAMKELPSECRGRLALAHADLNGGIVIVTIYGITGGRTAAQIPLWRQLVKILTALGLPYVIGGDWQVQPSELARMKLDQVLHGTICASGLPTNVQSGNELDCFLISNELASGGWEVRRSMDCSFEPHRPLLLTLKSRRESTTTRRLVQPRLLPVKRPIGPLLPNGAVAWEKWKAGEALDSMETMDEDLMEKAMTTWFAGAEHELFGALGVSGEDQAACSGVGLQPAFVTDTGQGHPGATTGVGRQRDEVCRDGGRGQWRQHSTTSRHRRGAKVRIPLPRPSTRAR